METKPKTIPFGAPPSATTTKPKTIPFGAKPVAPIPKEEGGVGAFVKSLVSAPATIVARPIQAGAALFGAPNEDIDTATKKIPILGDIIAPTPKGFKDVKKDVGRAAQTVALGTGAPIAGGALFGAGHSLEQGNDLLSVETAFNAALGGTAGKVLEFVGKPLLDATGKVVGKITPQILKDVAAGGAGAITKFAAQHQLLGGVVAKTSESIAKGLQGVDDAIVSTASKLVPKPSEKAIADRVAGDFNKSIKPLFSGTTRAQLEKKNTQVVDAVKLIQENAPNLKFTDDAGEAITGRPPSTVQELSEALDQTKRTVFNAYSALPKAAGEKGLVVNPASIAKELDSVVTNKALQLSNPEAVSYARALQERYKDVGDLSPEVVQDVIKNLNESLKAFYRNPTYTDASRAAIDAMVANNLRKMLDEGVEKLTGAQYQAIKNQYASLKAVERDIVRAAAREAKKGNRGLVDFTDIFTGGDILQGVLTLSPTAIARGAAGRGIKEFYKYLNDPNRAIQKMFQNAEKLPSRALFNVKPPQE